MIRIRLVLPFLLVTAGCSTVQPWERGMLAKPHMASEPFPLQRDMLEHIYGGREAATGGGAVKGGGCGCY